MKPESMTILTVDDTPANIRLLTHYLEKQGYRVITAEDGFEGFKAAMQHHPDLILLDVMMPGTDGYEVCELLKAEEETKNIPVMFLTAKADVEDKIRGFEMGAVDYITKPFNLAEISTRVENQLTMKHIQRQNVRYRKLIQSLAHLSNRGKIGEVFANAAREAVQTLEDELESVADDKFREKIRVVCHQFKHFVSLAIPEQPLRGPVQIRDILDAAIEDVQEAANGTVQFHVTIPDGVALVGDRGEIYQALWNVLFNAYEASSGGSTILIQAESGQAVPGELARQVAGNRAGEYLCIRISDDVQFDEAEAKVFEDPLQADPGSIGMVRYAATAGIVLDHEGAMRMLAGEKGRQVEIFLPM
ncbi:MAG TPA: hybrid sensor histidine kinase/response regulator [bacterium]|nr:hybrid sensor histidine kinase/response regulator [bacterium]